MSAARFDQALHGVQAGAQASCERKAALLLHGLDAGSRRWVLERLQPKERSLVEPLLAELSDLGVPVDAPWLHDLIDAVEKPCGCEASDASPRWRIEAAAPDEIHRSLEDEPPEIAQRLLALGPWPWQAELARSFGLLAPPAPTDAPALDAALLVALAQGLAVREAPAAAPKGVHRTLADVAAVIRRKFR